MPERSSTDECVDELAVCDVSPRGRCVRGRGVEDWPGFSEAFTGFSVVDVFSSWSAKDHEAERTVGVGTVSRGGASALLFISGPYRRTSPL